MGKIINQTLCLPLRRVIEVMPVIKISLTHPYFRLIYSLDDGIFLKFKLRFPDEFPHALQKLMIWYYLDCYTFLPMYKLMSQFITQTKRTFCSVTLLMCYCWCISNIPLLIILQKYTSSLYKLRLYGYKNISKSATSLKTFYYFSFQVFFPIKRLSVVQSSL